MKKFLKVAMCFVMCLSLGGCFNKMYTRTAKNDITCQGCVDVTNIDTLLSNVEKSMRTVSAASLDYKLTNTKKTYNIRVDAITKDNRVDWDLFSTINFDETDINVYLKDGKLYVIYPHNGANIIMKDTLKNFVTEAKTSLDILNANYDSENLEEFILGDKLAGFDFASLKEKATYVKKQDGTYLLTFVENDVAWEMVITSNYLFKEIKSEASNYSSTLTFSYPSEITVEYPMGLDFLTLDIGEVKEILKVDSFAEVVDEDLKNE